MSDIRYYYAYIMRTMPFVLLLAVVVGVMAYGIASRTPPSWEVHFSYLVSLSDREDAGEFRYDGYYALQSVDMFARTLADWISSPEVIASAHERANMDDVSDVRGMRRTVRAERGSAQLVHVVVRKGTASDAQELSRALMSVMDERIDAYHNQGQPAATFHVHVTDMWTGSTVLSAITIAFATFFFVFIVGINAVILKESVRRSLKQDT